MKYIRDLPDVIPVFPLPGALLLPRARLPLHLFEPRYLQMLEDCLKTPERLIGIIQPHEVLGQPDGLHSIGCAGRVTAFSETDDGRYMITLCGVTRFRLSAEVEGFSPYRRAKVDWQAFEQDRGGIESDPDFDRPTFLALLQRFLKSIELEADWDSLSSAEVEFLINALSMLCPFSPKDKQALLEAPTLSTRRATIVTLIEFALRGGAGEEIMQ